MADTALSLFVGLFEGYVSHEVGHWPNVYRAYYMIFQDYKIFPWETQSLTITCSIFDFLQKAQPF